MNKTVERGYDTLSAIGALNNRQNETLQVFFRNESDSTNRTDFKFLVRPRNRSSGIYAGVFYGDPGPLRNLKILSHTSMICEVEPPPNYNTANVPGEATAIQYGLMTLFNI